MVLSNKLSNYRSVIYLKNPWSASYRALPVSLFVLTPNPVDSTVRLWHLASLFPGAFAFWYAWHPQHPWSYGSLGHKFMANALAIRCVPCTGAGGLFRIRMMISVCQPLRVLSHLNGRVCLEHRNHLFLFCDLMLARPAGKIHWRFAWTYSPTNGDDALNVNES